MTPKVAIPTCADVTKTKFEQNGAYEYLSPSSFDAAFQVTALELEHHAAESKQRHNEKK